MKYVYKIGGWVALVLAALQLLLGIVSWILTAAMPEDFVHSLLSPEGIRWFFGSFVDNLSSPILIWLLLVSMAFGAVHASGLFHFDRAVYRQRIALRLVLIELVLSVGLMLVLTMVPHAILLNVMGGLWDSSFTRSLVPYLCFVTIVMGISFGVMSDRLKSVEEVFQGMTSGIGMMAPLFLIYVLVNQLYHSIVYLM